MTSRERQAMGVMGILGLYLLATAPILAILVFEHRIQSDDSTPFFWALLAQIGPLGLLDFPLGLIALVFLAWTLGRFWRRNQRFRRAGLWHPSLHRRWTLEYLAAIVALGLAVEQKAIGLVFLYAASDRGDAILWQVLLPASVAMWAAIGWAIRYERRILTQFGSPDRDPAGA